MPLGQNSVRQQDSCNTKSKKDLESKDQGSNPSSDNKGLKKKFPGLLYASCMTLEKSLNLLWDSVRSSVR